MLKINFFFAVLFSLNFAHAVGEVLVKAESVQITGTSQVGRDATNSVTIVYGGIAGPICASPVANSTCNTCLQAGTADACNLTGVHSTLIITVSFTLTKDIPGTGTIKAGVYVIADGASALSGSPLLVDVPLPAVAATTVQVTTTWGELCSLTGFPNCTGIADDQVLSGQLAFGIDSSGVSSGSAVDFDETKRVPIKLHHLTPASAQSTQTFCPATPAQGACNVKFLAGDQKAYVDSFPVALGVATSGIAWDGVAFFPISVPVDGTGDAAAYSTFVTNRVAPTIKALSAGNLADSSITGLTNYEKFCLVYGTKNLAQNIYKIVNDPLAAATGCIIPSEVVGILDDKHCFISTAAFGSEMAPEVQSFRNFRDQFLIHNYFGRKFIKFYYQEGPAAADLISKSEFLKSATRTLLYPVLGFVQISLQFGILAALLTLIVLLILFSQVSRFLFRNKKVSIMLFIFLLTPLLKAETKPQTKKVQHPAASDGLIRIKKDGTYVYDTGQTLKKESGHIRFGQAQSPNIEIEIEQRNAAGVSTGVTKYNFADFYEGGPKLIIGYDYERFFFIDSGKLGLQGGVSVMYASGRGRLKVVPAGQDGRSVERFTFLTLPINLGAVYRLEYKDNQLFVPYASGGATYLLLAEKREDLSKVNFAGGFGFYGAGGMLVNLGFLDPESDLSLDSEYGISNLWLSLEFKVVEVQAASFAFSNQYFNAGLSFDF